MKKQLLSCIFSGMLLILTVQLSAQVAINNDGSQPANSAMLDVKSATKGVLLPRITFEQRNSIVNPAEGLMIFCIDCGINGALSLYSNGAWRTYSPCDNNSPTSGSHIASPTQIIWNWSTVSGTIGYKWNSVNDYNSAFDMETSTTKTELGLNCNTSYNRYVWAYNGCGTSLPTTLTASTLSNPASPITGTHVPSAIQIVWNWNSSVGASGYKWNSANDYSTATDMGTSTTKTETGLTCNTPYTRYIWAYNVCGVSLSTIVTQNTSINPDAPAAGTHIPSITQIEWKWVVASGATGYRWNTTNDYNTAIDMGTNQLLLESGLTCNTAYTRYVWAYNTCGNSTATALNQSTLTNPPASPTSGTHVASQTQIVWNWNTVSVATGYKWNTTNNYASATDMGTNTTTTEAGLTCNTDYIRYAWAYNNCGYSTVTVLNQSTTSCVVLPSLSTTAVSNTTQTTATSGGNVTSAGGGTVTARGACWSTSPNPTIADSHTIDGNGTGTFVSNLTSLLANTPYYVRAYATNSAGTAYGNQEYFTTLSFIIGQNYGGGIIFYIDGTGQHGLISDISDLSNAEWGCYGTLIGGTSTTIGTGQSNTTVIVSGCSQSGIAARICNDLVRNGYSDWYLPSNDELYQMIMQKLVIGGFQTGWYWCSSEINASNAWMVDTYGGSYTTSKGSVGYVRACRSF